MKALQSLLPLFLASLFLCSNAACVHYQRYSMSKSRLQKINPEGLSVYIVDAAHPLTRSWYLSDPIFGKSSVSGFITRMAEVETLEMSMLRDRADAQQSRNDIILYARPKFARSLPDSATLSIQMGQFEKVEVCELNYLRSIGMPMMGCTGVLMLVYLVSGELD